MRKSSASTMAILLVIASASCTEKNTEEKRPDIRQIDTTTIVSGFFVKPSEAKTNMDLNSLLIEQAAETEDPTLANTVYTIFVDSAGLKLQSSKGFGDNLDELVGSIIEIKNVQNSKGNFRLLTNIVKDTVSLKANIITPAFGDIIKRKYDRSNAASISFVGINLGIDKNQIYTYDQSDIASLTVKSSQLDTNKISKNYRCPSLDNCNYFVITTATVTKVETRLYTGRTSRVKVDEFPYISQAFGASGALYTSKSNDDYTLKYFIYLQVRDVPSLLN